MRRPSIGRPEAIYVLAGGIVGAIASLLGAYVTSERQADLDALATRREAYAAFVAKAVEYGDQLSDMLAALRDGDEDGINAGYAGVRDASGELYVAQSVLWLVADERIGAAGQAVVIGFKYELPPEDERDPEKYDEEIIGPISEALQAGRSKIVPFIDIARRDLDGQLDSE